jgi:hypothetical protein
MGGNWRRLYSYDLAEPAELCALERDATGHQLVTHPGIGAERATVILAPSLPRRYLEEMAFHLRIAWPERARCAIRPLF